MNKQQLANKIWASANKMRSKIDANEYKDYTADRDMAAANNELSELVGQLTGDEFAIKG